MEEPEASIKRRKTGEREDTKNANEMRLLAAKESSTAPDKKPDSRSPYQMNPKAFERLRQITKDCKKAYVLPKDAKGGDKQNQEVVENGIVPPANKKSERKTSDDDVVISSVGSSPANSPKPTDLVVLSTSPKKNSSSDSQDALSSPHKRVKLIGISDNTTSLECRKRKFEEVVLCSQNVDTCSKSREREKANCKCNGNARVVYSDEVKSSVNHSAAPENLVSKGKQTDIVSSSSVNTKCESKQLENGSNYQNEQRKSAETKELPFPQCGQSLEPAKQANGASDCKSNELDKRKPVKTVYRNCSTDPSVIQQEGNISFSKEKEKPVLPVKNHIGKSIPEGERSSVKKQLVSSSSTLEKPNEEFTSPAKAEDFDQVESSQQSTSARRNCPDFNSYEFKEALKTLVAERMREMQKSFIGTPQTIMLRSRIEKLEFQNRELRCYSKKLEETVKDLLIKQKNRIEGRVCKEVQTIVMGARSPPATWPPSSSAVSEPSSSLVPRMTSSVLPRTNPAGSGMMAHHIPGNYVQHQESVQPLNPPLPKVSNEARVHSLVSQATSQSFSSHGAAVPQPVALRNVGPVATNRQRPVTATVHPQPTTVASNPPSRPPPPPYNSPRVAYTSVRPPASVPGVQIVCSVPGPVQSARPVVQVNQSPGLVQAQPGHGVRQLRAQIAPTQRMNVSVGAPHIQPPLLPSPMIVQPSRATHPADPSFVQSTPNHVQPTQEMQEMIIDRHTSPQTPYKPQVNFAGSPQVIPRVAAQGLHQAPPPGPPQVIPRAAAQGLHQAPPPGPQQGMIRVTPPVSMKTQTSVPRPPKVIPHGLSQQHSNPPGFQNDPPSGGLPRGPQPGLAMVRSPQEHFTPPSIEFNPTTDDVPSDGQSPVKAANTAEELPPKPTVSIAVVMSGIVLSWNMNIEENCAQIVSYQLFALQDNSSNSCQPTSNNPWKKIGVVKALPLPMACTLTQFLQGNRYHFMVRAVDKYGRTGSFSDPCTITLN